MKPLRIYLTGAQSCGKTTIARYISRQHNLPLVSEVVRQLRAEMERTLDDIRADLDAIDLLQENIFLRQLEREAEVLADGNGFVSDRSFDFICYTAAHSRITSKLAAHPDFLAYISSLKEEDALVFYVRPHKELIRADSDRSRLDLDWGEVCRIDGSIGFVLESMAIPYFPVASLSMRDRAALVDNVIKLKQDCKP